MEITGVDLDRWSKLVKKIQLENSMYPGRDATEADYYNGARILYDLFTKNFWALPGLESDFCLLFKEYSIGFDSARGEIGRKEVKYTGQNATDRCGYPEFIKATRIALGLTTVTHRELPSGIDKKRMVEFFTFLFRHCRSGFFLISKTPDPNDPFSPHENFWFDIGNGFDGVADFIASDPALKENSYQFYKFLFESPVMNLKTVRGSAKFSPAEIRMRPWVPCLWVDIDDHVPDLEEILSRYKIIPSIRVKTSPRGSHYFWILRSPLNIYAYYFLINVQVKLAKFLGGDVQRADFGPISRIPCLFNSRYAAPHFMSFETTTLEYDLSDFDRLPYGLFNLYLDYYKGNLKYDY